MSVARLKGPAMVSAVVLGGALLITVTPLRGEVILRDGLRAATSTQAAVYALAAMGLNIHFGYTGLLNFGQAGFMLVGAYGMAITVSTFGGPFLLGVLVGVGMSVLLALLLGLPTLRLRADYLAIVTIAAGEILRFVYRSSVAQGVTGGVFGIRGYARSFYNWNPIPDGTYGFWVIRYDAIRLWPTLVGWTLVLLSCVLVYMLVRSPWGRVLRAIREDEDAARSLGKNAYGYKMQSLVLGGVLGGLSGMLLGVFLANMTPDAFEPIFTFFAYAALILGGAASVGGPVVGAILFWFILESFGSFLRQAAALGYIPTAIVRGEATGAVRFALVGLGIILLMVYRPQGLLGNRREMQLDVR